jgi:hypothetical protein
MKHRLVNLSAGISFMLCMGTAVLWVHSYWAEDLFSIAHASARRATNPDGNPAWECTHWGISGEANSGRLVVSYDVLDDGLNTDESHVERGFRIYGFADRDSPKVMSAHPWFAWSNTFDGAEVGGEAALQIPLPIVFFLAALLPGLALRRIARERGRPESICRVCGYDRRATPGRCPECGAGFAPCGG